MFYFSADLRISRYLRGPFKSALKLLWDRCYSGCTSDNWCNSVYPAGASPRFELCEWHGPGCDSASQRNGAREAQGEALECSHTSMIPSPNSWAIAKFSSEQMTDETWGLTREYSRPLLLGVRDGCIRNGLSLHVDRAVPRDGRRWSRDRRAPRAQGTNVGKI